MFAFDSGETLYPARPHQSLQGDRSDAVAILGAPIAKDGNNLRRGYRQNLGGGDWRCRRRRPDRHRPWRRGRTDAAATKFTCGSAARPGGRGTKSCASLGHGRTSDFSASNPPTRSGWPPRRRPTRPTTSCAPSRRAGAAWCGRPWAKTRPSSTSTARAMARSGGADRGVLGLNNIELITDRPLEINLREIKQVKRDWPDRALIVSLMVPCDEEAGRHILPLIEDTGADGIELNFGCPHGMAERGMGVGGRPGAGICRDGHALVQEALAACPCIVKLTPNITDIRSRRAAAQARRRGCGVADQHHQLDHLRQPGHVVAPSRSIDGKGTHGGYCGPAVKPIALNMVAEIARDPADPGLPICGIGGITTWRDAAEFMALGAGNVQVCTAAMTYGFEIVQEMISGLSQLDGQQGYRSIDDFVGRAVPNVTDWQFLNLNYVTKAQSTRTPASAAAAAMSPARIPRTRPSPMAAGSRDVRGDRRRMRRLQPVRQRLPGAELHHHGGTAPGRRGRTHGPPGHRLRQLDAASEQPVGQGRSGICSGSACTSPSIRLLKVRTIALPGAVVQITGRHFDRHGPGELVGMEHGSRASSSAWRCRSRARWCCYERSSSATSWTPSRVAIAVGWLIVEDLAMVLALVFLPALAPTAMRRRQSSLLTSLAPDDV